jgi:heme/copper-type cytochrome/quinol oxidase subunit 4
MTEETTTLYCYVHPNRETSLRCKVCERPICASCAVRTPTGYSCKECVRSHQKKFDTAVWYDYVIGFVLSVILSAVAAFIVTLISGFFFGLIVLIVAPAAGRIIARILLAVLRRRRSRALFMTISGGMVFGAIPAIVSEISSLILFMNFYGVEGFSIWSLLPVIWIVIYLFITVPVVYSQFSGIRLTK